MSTCPTCRYPMRPESKERHADGLARPATRCVNVACPERPVCPKCGDSSTHDRSFGGGYAHLICRSCGQGFDPLAEELEE